MHCLGTLTAGTAAAGSVSGSNGASGEGSNASNDMIASGLTGRGGILSVFRALGVLVCEGRIQGPPRGYGEGPHCAPPMQSSLSEHLCEDDNYLCKRYFLLLREIAERTSVGSRLCVEVILCSDCPCGLARATCKHPVWPSPWQQNSEMLLEYWCISVVPSKGPETMNFQGLYQAVRSRLHFSQVAAWWSRSNGSEPRYVATRVVPHSEEILRKFRDAPVEHTFPLAGNGDGNAIRVTVWALPRTEDVPVLTCPLHSTKQKDEESVARAVTPTKANVPVASCSQSSDGLVLPPLVDDRLQTPCNKPGKHHCCCEEEDGSPPSPSISRPKGERKRRRSLPCGPSDNCASFQPMPLPSLHESGTKGSTESSSSCPGSSSVEMSKTRCVRLIHRFKNIDVRDRNTANSDSLERCFRTQLSIEEGEGNMEKRYKRTVESNETNDNDKERIAQRNDKEKSGLFENLVPFNSSLPWFFVESWSNGKCSFQSLRGAKEGCSSENEKVQEESPFKDSFGQQSNRFRECNPGPSTYSNSCFPAKYESKVSGTGEEEVLVPEIDKNNQRKGRDLSQLMSKLSFPEEKDKAREDGGFLDWFSRVPGRVLGVEKPKDRETRLKNCNLELSQREFDEVLAVLRARTPSGRRRSAMKTVKRRERSETLENDLEKRVMNSEQTCEKNEQRNGFVRYSSNRDESCDVHRRERITEEEKSVQTVDERSGSEKKMNESGERQQSVSNKADILLGAILRTSRDRKNDLPESFGDEKSDENVVYGTLTGKVSQEQKVGSYEEDRSLSVGLNKRFHRFRQFFKKEQERITLEDRQYQEGPSDRLRNLRESKVKRRIDFTGLPSTSFSDSSSSTKSNSHSTNTRSDLFTQNGLSYSANENEVSDKSETLFLKGPNEGDGKVRTGSRSKEEHGSGKREEEELEKETENEKETKKKKQKKKEQREDEEEQEAEEEALDKGVPSAIEQERFRRSLENAASMVFHSRTGLPLTSSPAPLRRGSCCFDYDSSLNSVSSKRSALFELNTPPSPGAVSLEEAENNGEETPRRRPSTRSRPQSHALLGSFEESALNGRLEPVSTVHGFTAELGASGSFCPKHRKLPVTVFFYTLGDNDKVSTPYLAHINLGKKGYQVPRSGTIQVTLLNPLGTVVKMFVVLYDLSDMPPRSHTFLRQRTLRDKTLRYLVHLRFMSGKTGRIYLHTDIRMIICRKADVDTASDFGSEPPKELRSYVHGPTNPKFSPRC